MKQGSSYKTFNVQGFSCVCHLGNSLKEIPYKASSCLCSPLHWPKMMMMMMISDYTFPIQGSGACIDQRQYKVPPHCQRGRTKYMGRAGNTRKDRSQREGPHRSDPRAVDLLSDPDVGRDALLLCPLHGTCLVHTTFCVLAFLSHACLEDTGHR